MLVQPSPLAASPNSSTNCAILFTIGGRTSGDGTSPFLRVPILVPSASDDEKKFPALVAGPGPGPDGLDCGIVDADADAAAAAAAAAAADDDDEIDEEEVGPSKIRVASSMTFSGCSSNTMSSLFMGSSCAAMRPSKALRLGLRRRAGVPSWSESQRWTSRDSSEDVRKRNGARLG